VSALLFERALTSRAELKKNSQPTRRLRCEHSHKNNQPGGYAVGLGGYGYLEKDTGWFFNTIKTIQFLSNVNICSEDLQSTYSIG
jgi:hypothetical protein